MDRLAWWLDGYDITLKNYLLEGFTVGFRIGYAGFPESKIYDNHSSTAKNPEVINEYIDKELAAGRIMGPLHSLPVSFQCSPLGLVPKKETGDFRIIHDLSYPPGKSVNDFIPSEFTFVQYESVYDAVDMIKQLGQEAFLAKSDIKNAFRIIPIHKDDQNLFLIQWNGLFYRDLVLEMGCSSACRIFEAFSSAIAWITKTKLGIPNVHYLDDFLLGSKTERLGLYDLNRFMDMCHDIGVPLSEKKTFPPATVMSFLGFEIDTVMKEFRLPKEKVDQCISELSYLLNRNKARLRRIQSVIGLLNFACQVVLPGRAFLRRLIDATRKYNAPFHWVRLSSSTKINEDLRVWMQFLSNFNGRSFFLSDEVIDSDQLNLFTDASGSIGYAAIFGKNWFYGQWTDDWRGQNIMLLEMYPIVLAIETWGEKLQNKRLIINTDNESLVPVLSKKTTKEHRVMSLVRRLVLACLKYNILISARHVAGSINQAADALSRLQLDKFYKLCPDANVHPSVIPHLPPLPS